MSSPPSPSTDSSLTYSPPRKARAKKGEPNHVPRPMNSFMCFRSVYCQQLKQQQPDQTLDQSEVSQVAATKWRSLPDEQKQFYIDMAKEKEIEYKRKFANCSPSPRARTGQKQKQKGRTRSRAQTKSNATSQSSPDLPINHALGFTLPTATQLMSGIPHDNRSSLGLTTDINDYYTLTPLVGAIDPQKNFFGAAADIDCMLSISGINSTPGRGPCSTLWDVYQKITSRAVDESFQIKAISSANGPVYKYDDQQLQTQPKYHPLPAVFDNSLYTNQFDALSWEGRGEEHQTQMENVDDGLGFLAAPPDPSWLGVHDVDPGARFLFSKPSSDEPFGTHEDVFDSMMRKYTVGVV